MMAIDWQGEKSFAALAQAAQIADFRNDAASLRTVPRELIEHALAVCSDKANAEAQDAYRFLVNTVRGLNRTEPRSALWLVEVMDASHEPLPDIAWDAAVEVLRLFQPLLRSRMQQASVCDKSFKQNPLAVVEACFYSMEANRDDVLIGALMHSAYRTVLMREESSRLAAVFAGVRELYGYLRAGEKSAAIRSLSQCRTQSPGVYGATDEIRGLLVDSLIGANGPANDSGEYQFCEQILLLAIEWAPPTGNARAGALNELGKLYKDLGRLDEALRSLKAGTEVAGVDDAELHEALRLEFGVLRAELENAPELIAVPQIALDGLEGASEAMQSLQAVMVRNAGGERVTDEEKIKVIATMHTWNRNTASLAVQPSTRLNQALLMLSVAMSLDDPSRSPVHLMQLLSDAESLRSAAGPEQMVRLEMLRKAMRGM